MANLNIDGTVIETVKGTPENDTFESRNGELVNSTRLDGLGGTDTVSIIVDEVKFNQAALRPDFTSIEIVKISAQGDENIAARGDDDNSNAAGNDQVNVDAQDMSNTAQYWSTDSRADLMIEDIRRESAVTTIVWQQADAGNVNYTALFNPSYITDAGEDEAGAQLTIDLVNVQSLTLTNGKSPLGDNPYLGFKFSLNDVEYTVDPANFNTDDTYAKLAATIDDFLKNDLGLTNLSAVTGNTSNVFNSDTGVIVGVKTEIIVKSNSAGTLSVDPLNAWIADGELPADNNMQASIIDIAPETEGTLTQVDVVLDDVGNGTGPSAGSKSGNLVIGNMSTGNNSGSAGIQQFNVDVQDTSWLNQMSSTNNTLESVILKHETASQGAVRIDLLQDVQTVNASAMVGSVTLGIALTDRVINKYMDLEDSNANAATDNINFNYATGTNDDSVIVRLDDGNFASLGNSLLATTNLGTAGREDMVINVDTGEGNDVINMYVVTNAAASSATSAGETLAPNGIWYTNQKLNSNITIDAGAGNDTVRTPGAGDMTINAGSGDDTVYTNNDGNIGSGRTAEVQTITVGAATAAGGIVTTTLANGSVYDTIIAAGDTAIAAAGKIQISLSSGVRESTVVTIAAGITAGNSITINGVTLTAVQDMTSAEANTAIVTGVTAGLGTVTGTNDAAFAVVNAGATLVYTSAVAGPVADLALSTTGPIAVSTATVQGATALGAAANDNGNGTITINYPADFMANEDIGNAEVSDQTTGTTGVSARTAGAGAAVAAVTAVQEVQTITPGGDIAALTAIIDGVTITFADTDNDGVVTAYEAQEQIAAANFPNWTVTDNDLASGTIELTQNVGALVAFAITGTGAQNGTDAETQTGAPAVAQTPHTAGAFDTLTMTDSFTDGTITVNIDVDGDGVIGTNEMFEVDVTTGSSGDVAAEVAAALNGITGITAAQGVAGAPSANTVVITWPTTVVTVPASTTVVDGGIETTTTFETIKGLDASRSAAAWVVNADNTNIANLDSSDNIADSIIFDSVLTVTYSGASSMGASGVTSGAAGALTNGFEATATIPSSSNVGNQAEINQAIKEAINEDTVMSKLLVATDGPANTLVITSLVDGQVLSTDLSITMAAKTTYNAGELASISEANRDVSNDSSLPNLTNAQAVALINTNLGLLDNAGDYATPTLTTTNTILGASRDNAGTTSVTTSDNTVNMGSGNDVLVLGVDANSNDTLVYTGTNNGMNTVFNFTEAGTAADAIDFTAYLNAQSSASGSGSSATDIAITFNGDNEAGANEVTIINDFADYATSTLAEITAGYTVENVASLVGTTYSTIFMVENGANDGEYKVYNVTATDAAANFSNATLIGQVDFGNTLTSVSDANFDGTIGA